MKRKKPSVFCAYIKAEEYARKIRKGKTQKEFQQQQQLNDDEIKTFVKSVLSHFPVDAIIISLSGATHR